LCRKFVASLLNNFEDKILYNFDFLKLLLILIILLLKKRHYFIRFTGNEGLPDILHDSAGDPLSPKLNRVVKPMFPLQKNNRKDGSGGVGSGLKGGMDAVRMSMLNGSSLGSSYDRSHITGSVSERMCVS